MPELNEDSVEIDIASHRVAVSDGASESFDSRNWSRIIAQFFIKTPRVDDEWITGVINEYLFHQAEAEFTWSQQAAFERGSFATLIGLEYFNEHKSADVFAIGDSLAVLLSGDRRVDSFPYTNWENFKQRPTLLCTKRANNSFISNSNFYTLHSKTWGLGHLEHARLFLMTDALAEWALRREADGDPAWSELFAITDVDHLVSFVESERKAKRIRLDDVTFVSIDFG